MNKTLLKKKWLEEEAIAHIHGWNFSHINKRYTEETDLPWDYRQEIEKYLTKDKQLLDMDTGGGEFLLSLKHPYEHTSVTEAYPPNLKLCQETLAPLGIKVVEGNSQETLPFENDSFDIIINRHGSFNANELKRMMKLNGIFITEQVGKDNDRDLVLHVLKDTPLPFPNQYLEYDIERLQSAGLKIIEAKEVYRPIRFYDVGAFVWFAHIIEWEFPNFSVEKCFDQLIELQKQIEEYGYFEGTIHRYFIIAKNI